MLYKNPDYIALDDKIVVVVKEDFMATYVSGVPFS